MLYSATTYAEGQGAHLSATLARRPYRASRYCCVRLRFARCSAGARPPEAEWRVLTRGLGSAGAETVRRRALPPRAGGGPGSALPCWAVSLGAAPPALRAASAGAHAAAAAPPRAAAGAGETSPLRAGCSCALPGSVPSSAPPFSIGCGQSASGAGSARAGGPPPATAGAGLPAGCGGCAGPCAGGVDPVGVCAERTSGERAPAGPAAARAAGGCERSDRGESCVHCITAGERGGENRGATSAGTSLGASGEREGRGARWSAHPSVPPAAQRGDGGACWLALRAGGGCEPAGAALSAPAPCGCDARAPAPAAPSSARASACARSLCVRSRTCCGADSPCACASRASASGAAAASGRSLRIHLTEKASTRRGAVGAVGLGRRAGGRSARAARPSARRCGVARTARGCAGRPRARSARR